MPSQRVRSVAGPAVLLLGFMVSACSGPAAGLTPSAADTTTVQGWEHWFRLEWTPPAGPHNEIGGYVYNTYGEAAVNVQILAQGLDATGNMLNQKIEWVPGIVPGSNRAPFRVAGLAPAPRYRVSVWAFDFVQTGAPQR